MSAQNNRAPGVEIVLLKMIFESRRDAVGAFGSPGYMSLSPPTVSCTGKGHTLMSYNHRLHCHMLPSVLMGLDSCG